MKRRQVQRLQQGRYRGFEEVVTEIGSIRNRRLRQPSKGKTATQITNAKISGVRDDGQQIAPRSAGRRQRTVLRTIRHDADLQAQGNLRKLFLKTAPAFLGRGQHVSRVS